MHRNEGANNVNGLFTDGPPPTVISAEIMNALQEEIAYVIEQTGEPLLQASNDTKTQLKAAIENMISTQFGTVNRYLHLLYNGINNSLVETDADGSIYLMSNVYESGNVVKQRNTGTSLRFELEGADGTFSFSYYTGSADDTILVTDWVLIATSGPTKSLITRGQLIGGIEFNTTALPPIVKAGDYEINNRIIKLTVDDALALNDAFGSCSQALADYAYQWIFILIRESDGARFWAPAYDITSPILTGVAVTSVTVTAGTAVCATGNTAGLVVADGHNVVVMGSSAGVISGQLTAVVLNTSFSVKTNAADGVYTGGTYDAYYRIYTEHKGPAGIIVDADIGVYTPSPPHCPALNIYGVDQYGRPTATAANVYARIIGPAFIGAAGAADKRRVISYKDGFNKNDNFIVSETATSLTATNTAYKTFVFERLWGNDYVVTDDATNGMVITFRRRLSVNATASIYSSVTGGVEHSASYYINGTVHETATLYASFATYVRHSLNLPYEMNEDDALDIRYSAIGAPTSHGVLGLFCTMELR